MSWIDFRRCYCYDLSLKLLFGYDGGDGSADGTDDVHDALARPQRMR